MQEPTENQLRRTKADWDKVAEEPLQIEWVKGVLYAYGSELAVLRLFHHYRQSFKAGKEVRGRLQRQPRDLVLQARIEINS